MSPGAQIISLYILVTWQANTVLSPTEVHVNEQLFISVNEMFSPICSKGKLYTYSKHLNLVMSTNKLKAYM